jgi:predicted nucleic acid-binding Zn ribbon protein
MKPPNPPKPPSGPEVFDGPGYRSDARPAAGAAFGSGADRGPQPRTTASNGHSCEQCGRSLTGRKQRFCSDRCRMRARRQEQAARVNELLTTIEESVTALRGELERSQ